jgi:hypothetical protein
MGAPGFPIRLIVPFGWSRNLGEIRYRSELAAFE